MIETPPSLEPLPLPADQKELVLRTLGPMNPFSRMIAILIPLIALAAACGDDDAGAGPTSAPSPTPAPTAPAPTASAAPPGTATPGTDAPTGPAAATTTTAPQVGPLEITTADGLVLEAERFGLGEDFVVLAHMRPANQTSWFSFAGLLAGEGYSAITFNFRGYGNSDGAGFDVDGDVLAAVDAAFDLGARRVFIIGASMGGTGAVAAAAQRDVAGVITLSAPAQFQGTDAEAASANLQTGILLIAAEGDAPYPADAEAMRIQAGDLAEVIILSGRSHGTDLFRDHSEELTTTILRYLAAQP